MPEQSGHFSKLLFAALYWGACALIAAWLLGELGCIHRLRLEIPDFDPGPPAAKSGR